jgi:hypothetical protein
MAKITSSIPLLGGVKIHNDLNGLNDGDYKHLTALEKTKFDSIPDNFALVATSNDYNDLDNLPTIPTPLVNHSELNLDDGSNPHGTTKTDVGLGNVDNTSDLNKPVSNATQTALNGKSNIIHMHTKADVGLSNVDNTSDNNKPVSIATQIALNTKQDSLFNFYTKEGFLFLEDFLGNPGTSSSFASYGLIPAISGAGATCIPTTSYPNRTNQQGVLQLGTGTTATGLSNIRLGDNNVGSIYTGNGEIIMQCFYNVQTLSTITERFYDIIGFTTSGNFASTNTISFIYDEGGIGNYGSASANWKCITRFLPTTTATITTVPVVASQWYVLKIVINSLGNSISFFIDNILVATHTTNIPNLITPRIAKTKTIGTTNRNSFLDYVIIQQIYATPRTL